MKSTKLGKLLGEEALTVVGEIIAIYIAVRVNNLTGPYTALIALIGGSWLLYNVSSYEKLWNTIGMLQDPARASILYASAASIYFSIKSYILTELIVVILASALIGAGLAILFQAYWNIGG